MARKRERTAAGSKIERKNASESRFESHGGSYCAPRDSQAAEGRGGGEGCERGRGEGRCSLERGERIN